MKVMGVSGIFVFFSIALLIVVLVAWLMAISLFINAAKEKGYYKDGGAGILWFIGIFATPIVVGIYTTALPDKSGRDAISNASAGSKAASIQDELPSL